jgi:hypothetical protein
MTKTYINTKTNEYPLYVGDLWLLGLTETDLPEYVSEVEVTIPEDYNPEIHFLSQETPELREDNKYHAVFNIREFTEEEKKIQQIAQIKTKVILDLSITEEEAQLLINR